MFNFLKKSQDSNEASFWKECAAQYKQETAAAEETLSIVHAQKNVLERQNEQLFASMKALASHIIATKGNAQAVYASVAALFDPDGIHLYKQAQIIFGKFNYDGHFEEFWSGKYNTTPDTVMAQYLLEDARKLGDLGLEENVEESINQVYVNALVTAEVISDEHYFVPSRKPLPLLCSDMVSDEQVKRIYWKWQRKLDGGGFALLRAAEDILGDLEILTFPYEANTGFFEGADGFTMLRYLKVQYADSLGDHTTGRWAAVSGTCYERCISMVVDESTETYRDFEAKLYKKVCLNLGLMFKRKDIEHEMLQRDLCEQGLLSLEAKGISPLDPYTINEMGSALRGCK